MSDPISEILQDLRIAGASYGYCHFAPPWGVHIPAEPTARLHVVVAGESWVWLDEGDDPIVLRPCDAIFLAQGCAHSLAHAPHTATRPYSEFQQEPIGDSTFRMRVGEGNAQTLMACCAVRFDQPAVHPVLDMMPPMIVVRRATECDTTMSALLDAMAEEVVGDRLGSATILKRLADVVVTRIIRAWAADQSAPVGWLAALRDKHIGRALAAIHREPGRSWTVVDLAAAAGLSRSIFCERFARLSGQSPARYVAQWRMHLASDWLRTRRVSVAEAADQLGYGSEAAFSRAFKRTTGSSPGEWRRS